MIGHGLLLFPFTTSPDVPTPTTTSLGVMLQELLAVVQPLWWQAGSLAAALIAAKLTLAATKQRGQMRPQRSLLDAFNAKLDAAAAALSHMPESEEGGAIETAQAQKPQRIEAERERLTKRERQTAGLTLTAADMVAEGGYEIASLAGRFTERTNELTSIRSTADTQTRWILSEPMRDDLKKSGVDFSKLKEKPTTVYVILPAERMRTHSVWLRLVIVSALRALYRPGGLRTLLLIDEMPALGHLAPLEDAFGLVRGYKVQIAGICQDLAQLKALYKERWESFLANAGVVQGFTPNDLTTADWMSRRAGQTTLVAENSSESRQAQGHRNETTSWQQVGRALYLPYELMGFAEGSGLLFLAGMANGVRFFAPPYWKIDACAARAGRNPYYEG